MRDTYTYTFKKIFYVPHETLYLIVIENYNLHTY